MKAILFTLLSTFLFCTSNLFAQNGYEQKMKEYVSVLDSTPDLQTNNEMIYNFERLMKVYPEEWTIKYYKAYCIFRKALLNPQEGESHLEETLRYIESIDKNILENHVDFIILKARVLFTMLSFSPSKGSEYSPIILSLLDISLEKEPENSRAYYVYGLYYYHLPKFVGGNKNKACEYFKKAFYFFTNEDKNEIPHWAPILYENGMKLCK